MGIFASNVTWQTHVRPQEKMKKAVSAKQQAWSSNSTELIIRLNCIWEYYKDVRDKGSVKNDSEFMTIIACRCVRLERKANKQTSKASENAIRNAVGLVTN